MESNNTRGIHSNPNCDEGDDTMINVTEEDIGRKVVYRIGKDNEETGVITSYNDYGVFVRYGNNTGSQSTHRADLEWEIK